MTDACRYCGGALVKVSVRVGENKWSILPSHVDTIAARRCVKCGREPAVKCWNCGHVTAPCNVCLMQRCMCRSALGEVHWLGGQPLQRGDPPVTFERKRLARAGA